MKKLVCFLFAAVVLFGVAVSANANSYTLSYTTSTSPDNDLNVFSSSPGSGGTAFTVIGTSSATATSQFDSATLSVIFDSPAPTISYLAAWLDSGRSLGYPVTAASIATTTFPGETGNHYLVTFNNFSSLASFGSDDTGSNHWYDNSLLMGIAYYDTCAYKVEVDGASLTVNYHNGTGVPGVPEPATMLLLGFGLFGVGFVGRKIKK